LVYICRICVPICEGINIKDNIEFFAKLNEGLDDFGFMIIFILEKHEKCTMGSFVCKLLFIDLRKA